MDNAASFGHVMFESVSRMGSAWQRFIAPTKYEQTTPASVPAPGAGLKRKSDKISEDEETEVNTPNISVENKSNDQNKKSKRIHWKTDTASQTGNRASSAQLAFIKEANNKDKDAANAALHNAQRQVQPNALPLKIRAPKRSSLRDSAIEMAPANSASLGKTTRALSFRNIPAPSSVSFSAAAKKRRMENILETCPSVYNRIARVSTGFNTNVWATAFDILEGGRAAASKAQSQAKSRNASASSSSKIITNQKPVRQTPDSGKIASLTKRKRSAGDDSALTSLASTSKKVKYDRETKGESIRAFLPSGCNWLGWRETEDGEVPKIEAIVGVADKGSVRHFHVCFNAIVLWSSPFNIQRQRRSVDKFAAINGAPAIAYPPSAFNTSEKVSKAAASTNSQKKIQAVEKTPEPSILEPTPATQELSSTMAITNAVSQEQLASVEERVTAIEEALAAKQKTAPVTNTPAVTEKKLAEPEAAGPESSHVTIAKPIQFSRYQEQHAVAPTEVAEPTPQYIEAPRDQHPGPIELPQVAQPNDFGRAQWTEPVYTSQHAEFVQAWVPQQPMFPGFVNYAQPPYTIGGFEQSIQVAPRPVSNDPHAFSHAVQQPQLQFDSNNATHDGPPVDVQGQVWNISNAPDACEEPEPMDMDEDMDDEHDSGGAAQGEMSGSPGTKFVSIATSAVVLENSSLGAGRMSWNAAPAEMLPSLGHLKAPKAEEEAKRQGAALMESRIQRYGRKEAEEIEVHLEAARQRHKQRFEAEQREAKQKEAGQREAERLEAKRKDDEWAEQQRAKMFRPLSMLSQPGDFNIKGVAEKLQGHESLGNDGREVCRKYLRGNCPWGEKCRYKHDKPAVGGQQPPSLIPTEPRASSDPSKPKLPCKFHAKGKCKNGTACRYSHELSSNAFINDDDLSMKDETESPTLSGFPIDNPTYNRAPPSSNPMFGMLPATIAPHSPFVPIQNNATPVNLFALPLKTPNSKNSIPCHFFWKRGHCNMGDTCEYSHDVPPNGHQESGDVTAAHGSRGTLPASAPGSSRSDHRKARHHSSRPHKSTSIQKVFQDTLKGPKSNARPLLSHGNANNGRDGFPRGLFSFYDDQSNNGSQRRK